MNHSLLLRAFAALSALAFAAPGAASAQRSHAAERAAALLIDRPPAREKGCRIEGRPKSLPAADAIVDTALLNPRIREFAVQNHVSVADTMHLLLSLSWDRGGDPENGHAINGFMPQGASDRFVPAVRVAMSKQRGETHLRLRVDFAEQPVYHVGRSEICEPMGLEAVFIEATAASQVERPRPVRVRVTVGAHGEMLGSTLLGSSGQQFWDDVVNHFVNAVRYTPGMVDGEPVVMQYEQTVNFQAH